MPRKRQDADQALPPDVETVPEQDASGISEKPRAIKDRLSITLKGDGSIDFDSLRGSTREKLQRALASSGNLGSGPAIALRVNRDFIPNMYMSLCAGIQLGGQKLFSWPADLTKHMRFTSEELETLKEPTAKVIEKHAPAWLLTHQEEFALAQAIIVASKSMVDRAVALYVLSVKTQSPETPTAPTEE